MHTIINLVRIKVHRGVGENKWLILLNEKQDRLINQDRAETNKNNSTRLLALYGGRGGSLSMVRLVLAWPSLTLLCWSERNGQHKELVETMRTQPTSELQPRSASHPSTARWSLFRPEETLAQAAKAPQGAITKQNKQSLKQENKSFFFKYRR